MYDVIVLGLLSGGVLALIAVGLTLVFGVMDVVNFAHGEFVMLGMLGTAILSTSTGLSPYVSGLVVVLIAVPATAGAYFLVIRPTLNKGLYVQVFATLGLSIVLQSAALMAFGPETVAVQSAFASKHVSFLGVPVELGRVIAFGVALLLVAALWVVLERTRVGYQIRAVAQDEYAARVIGIRVSVTYAAVFILGGVFAVAGGALIVPFQAANPTTGNKFVLTAFVVVVLGGLGSFVGALVGGFLIGIVETAVGYYFGTEWVQAATFIVFVAVLLLRASVVNRSQAGGALLQGSH